MLPCSWEHSPFVYRNLTDDSSTLHPFSCYWDYSGKASEARTAQTSGENSRARDKRHKSWWCVHSLLAERTRVYTKHGLRVCRFLQMWAFTEALWVVVRGDPPRYNQFQKDLWIMWTRNLLFVLSEALEIFNNPINTPLSQSFRHICTCNCADVTAQNSSVAQIQNWAPASHISQEITLIQTQ